MKRTLRRIGWSFILVLSLFTVGRGLVELLTIQWGDPASYRADWGGPSLFGVLLVHSGPGVVGGAILVASWRKWRTDRETAG